MKRMSFLAAAVLASISLTAQQQGAQEQKRGPYLRFEKRSHDFGDIEKGEVVEYTYLLENTGDAPLILSNVQTTCGCTTPYWPREPIAPGAKEKIKAKFDSTGRNGRQNKVITITSNASNSPTRISLIANVLPKAEDAQPEKSK